MGGGDPGGSIDIVDAAGLSTPAFEDLYDNVLVPSFPPDELLTLEEFRGGNTGESRTPAFVMVERARPIAAAFGDFDPDSGMLLLAYLATRADRRSLGLGRRLLIHALEGWRQLRPAAVLAEIEDPAAHGTSSFGDPVARVRFYHSVGATRLDLPYCQPALRPGANRVRGMLLISFAAAGDPAGGVPADRLAAYLRGYLAVCEGLSDTAADADADFGPIFARLDALAAGPVPESSLLDDPARQGDP